MKKNIKRAAAEDKRYTADKVSLRECLGIFKNIRLPWGLMTAGVIFALLAAYATLQVSSFSGSAVDASGDIPVREMVVYVITARSGLHYGAARIGKLGRRKDQLRFAPKAVA